MTRVLVAAISEVVRIGLESIVAASPVLSLVGSSVGVDTLAQQVENLQPDVVLLELELQTDEPVPALLALGAGLHAFAVVLLADDLHGPWAVEVLRSGVRAILPRDATAGEIVAAIEAVAAGLVALHPAAVDILMPVILPSAERALPASLNRTLTPREVEVLGMIAEGQGNKEIAWHLSISEHTVKFHIGSILSKLNASSRTEAVTIGIRQGLIML